VTGRIPRLGPTAQVAAFYKRQAGAPGATVTSFLGNTIVKLKKGPQEFHSGDDYRKIRRWIAAKTRMTIMHMMHKPS